MTLRLTLLAALSLAGLRSGIAQQPPVPRLRVVLPSRLAPIGPGAPAARISVRPVVEIESFIYDGAAREFRGALRVGLEDSLDPAASRVLPTPIAFLVSGNHVRVSPANLAIRHTNLPFVLVELAIPTPDDSVRVHVRTVFDPRGVDLMIPVERPAIILDLVTDGVPGFGLGVATMHVTLPPEAGTARRVVRLLARRASPEPSELALAGGETRDAFVRSVTIGTDTLSAESAPFQAARLAVHYTWPVHFFLTSLGGGLFGSVLARSGARRRGKGASHGAYLLGGLLTGLFVAVAFAVGLNLTGLKLVPQNGEAVIVVVSALGSIFGLPGLGRAVPVLGRALKGSPSLAP